MYFFNKSVHLMFM